MTNKTKKILLGAAAALMLFLLIGRSSLRHQRLPIESPQTILIPTGSCFDDVVDSLNAHGCIVNEAMFRSASRVRHYAKHVKPGCYILEPGMGLVRVVNKLYYGNQDAIRITLNKHRTKEQLADFLASKLELQADSLLALLNDSATTADYGYAPNTIIAMFVQNTYEIYWNTSPQKLMDRMHKESKRFWSDLRMAECKEVGLSPIEVVTLASIVEEETNKNDEKALIASVYLNRLRKGMLLQADPTLKYACGDFTLKRILNKHKHTDSPYNTYLYPGLPPGPICIPSVASIDAVLSNHPSNYLYFCAKEDFSGYHNFASSLSEHERNAARFHQALNQRGIK